MKLLRQRLWACCLVIGILLGVLSLSVSAQSESAAASGELLAQAIDQQIRDYAKSIDQQDADDAAARALAKHGVTQRGATLKAGENHPLTATLMNAELTLQCFTDGLAKGIQLMQLRNMQTVYPHASFDWGRDTPYYHMNYYATSQIVAGDKLNAAEPHLFTGSLNGYDQSLVWIAGSTNAKLVLKQVSITAKTVVYDVSVTFYDRFDFSGDNGSISKDILSLLGSFLFREFDWEATAHFTLEVPNTCTHSPEKYHLTYDPAQKQITSHTDEGFVANAAQQVEYDKNGETRQYYALEKAITLRHDLPWTLEYTVKNSNKISLSPAQSKDAKAPYLMDYRRDYLVIAVHEQDSTGSPYMSYYGIAPRSHFDYNARDTYTFRLQNVVNPDGSNMIYVTAYNETLQETVLENMPMDDRFTIENGSWHKMEDASNGVSGLDLQIQYLGNASYWFRPEAFCVKIWESGQDPAEDACFDKSVMNPTCTDRGYTTFTCKLCGYAYQDAYTEPSGHTPADPVKQNETPTGYDLVVLCKTCATELSREQVTVHTPGDVNGDGAVNNKDISRLFQHLSGWDVEVKEAVLDINGDGTVNNKDVTRLFQYLSGWDVKLH